MILWSEMVMIVGTIIIIIIPLRDHDRDVQDDNDDDTLRMDVMLFWGGERLGF
jgi:hypothetical protein